MEHLFNFTKIEYIRGKKRPDVDCILCAVRDSHPDVAKLEVFRSKYTIASVNLYPYNSGHLLIFPIRHIQDIRELTRNEVLDIELVTRAAIDIIQELYSPSGFNVGYNLGSYSGASIPHIHRHVIPRYPNEIGFVDLVGGAKIIIEDPKETMVRLKDAFDKFDFENYFKD